MMKKIIQYSVIIILSVGCIQPLIAYGAPQPNQQFQWGEQDRQLQAFGGEKGANLRAPSDPRVVVARLIKTSLGVIGIIAVVLALYAGFLIMTSSGNEEKIAEGKKILMYCTAGVAIILGSYSITYFIYTGIYSSWTNPMTIGNQGDVYIQQNNPTLYNPDPLEQNTVIQ